MSVFCDAVRKGRETAAIEAVNRGQVNREVACGAVRVSAEKGMNILVQRLFCEFTIPINSMLTVLEVYKKRKEPHMVRTILAHSPEPAIDSLHRAKIAEICKAMKLWDLVDPPEPTVSEDGCLPWFSKKA